MKSGLSVFGAATAFLFSSLACAFVMGKNPSVTQAATATFVPIPLVATPTQAPFLFCPKVTEKILEVSTVGSDGVDNLLDEEIFLVSYAVSGDEISNPYYADVDEKLKDEQNDLTAHQQAWNHFTALIPADQRELISEYAVVTDGRDGTLAAVVQTDSDPNLWALEVDVADSADFYSFSFTIIHEFGHLLALGPDQVPPNLAVFNNPEDDNIYLDAVSACPQYFPGEGCANPDSRINAFYDQFWADIHEEWNAINLEEDETLYYEKLNEFFYKYEDRFITDYAATNPEEDMAETWAFFVLAAKPVGDTIAEEKILFFYQYPELVQLRAQILNNLCATLSQ